MRHEALKFLYDIQEACELLEQFIEGKSYSIYTGDPLLRSGVERQLTIIGEALNQALKIEPPLEDSITDARKIISFRNFLVHGYSTISNETVWGILETGLPQLHREVKTLLEKK